MVSGEAGVVGSCSFWVNGPDFEGEAVVQTRVAARDVGGFFETVSENEPVAADHFLGFPKGAVGYPIFLCNRFASIRESLSAFHFALTDQSIEPCVELVDGVLYFIARDVAVPLASGNYQVFG